MNKNSKDFLVSTADVAFFVDDNLAFTGTTSLNTSLSVSMEDQEVVGGKGNKTLYKYKYGRKLSASIEMAEWNLAYIAANIGSKIFEGLENSFMVAECVTLTNGIGTLSKTPIGNVSVEKSDGTIVSVKPVGFTITVDNVNDVDNVKATYQYNTNVKSVVVDADSTPYVGRLVLTADKHNNMKGKVGEIQIEIPSFQLNGTFDINLEASGTTTTKMDGDALAVDGSTCKDGAVYAYIRDIPSEESFISVSEIAATPSIIRLKSGENSKISVIGIKGGLYSNVAIETESCIIESNKPEVARVDGDTVVAVSRGNAVISVNYKGVNDSIDVIVDGGDELISSETLTLFQGDKTLLGKNVSDMVETDLKVYKNGDVSGTFKKITGFTEFSSKKEEQSGYFFPFKLTKPGTKMTLKKNGVTQPDKENMAFDSEIILRVSGTDVFNVEVDGAPLISFNFKHATFK